MSNADVQGDDVPAGFIPVVQGTHGRRRRSRLDRPLGLCTLRDFLEEVRFEKTGDVWHGQVEFWQGTSPRYHHHHKAAGDMFAGALPPAQQAAVMAMLAGEDGTFSGLLPGEQHYVVKSLIRCSADVNVVREQAEHLAKQGKLPKPITGDMLDLAAKKKVIRGIEHLLDGHAHVLFPITEEQVAAGFSFGNLLKDIAKGALNVVGPIAKGALSAVVGPGIANAAFGIVEGIANGDKGAEAKAQAIGVAAKAGDEAAKKSADILRQASALQKQAESQAKQMAEQRVAQMAQQQKQPQQPQHAASAPAAQPIVINNYPPPKADGPRDTRYQPPPLTTMQGEAAGSWLQHHGYVTRGGRG